MIAWIVALLAGFALGWFVHGRSTVSTGLATRDSASPALLPDPALRWLLRAHDALGVWLSESGDDDDDPSNERVIDADRLSVQQVVGLDRRIERARDEGRSATERVDTGTFMIRAKDGVAVGLLLPPAAVAMERLPEVEEDLDRLLEGLRQRPQLLALAQARSDSLAIESIGSVALRLAYQLERLTHAAAVVASTDPDGVRVVGVSGQSDRRLLERLVPADCGLAQTALGRLDRHVSDADPIGGGTGDRRLKPAKVMVLPIDSGQRRIGAAALWLPGDAGPHGAVLAELLECIRDAGPRLDHAQQFASKSAKAATDQLTGLANRRALEEAMNRPGQSQGVLILADIDHFKRLNDTHGHPAGDAALIHLAQLLREQVRANDTAARVGGEEFALWLPRASLEMGRTIAERIRNKIGTTAWDWQGSPWPLTASFGVASCPDTSMSVHNLMQFADKALYVAKQAGRNRVEVAGGGET